MVGENTPGYGYFLDEQDKAAGKDVPPLETMAQAMKRLRREKRWKEFCKLRADYKRNSTKRCRRQGLRFLESLIIAPSTVRRARAIDASRGVGVDVRT